MKMKSEYTLFNQVLTQASLVLYIAYPSQNTKSTILSLLVVSYRQIFHQKTSIKHLPYLVILKIAILTMDMRNLYKNPSSCTKRPVKYKFLFVVETRVPPLNSS